MNNDDELRKFILDYLREKMTVDVQVYENGTIAVRLFLDNYLIDADYSHHRKQEYPHG